MASLILLDTDRMATTLPCGEWRNGVDQSARPGDSGFWWNRHAINHHAALRYRLLRERWQGWEVNDAALLEGFAIAPCKRQRMIPDQTVAVMDRLAQR